MYVKKDIQDREVIDSKRFIVGGQPMEVERDVNDIINPGTLIDASLLNYLQDGIIKESEINERQDNTIIQINGDVLDLNLKIAIIAGEIDTGSKDVRVVDVFDEVGDATFINNNGYLDTKRKMIRLL